MPTVTVPAGATARTRATAPVPSPTRTRTRTRARNVILGILIAVALVAQLLPFYVSLTTALKPRTDLSSQLVPPHTLFLGNFVTAIQDGGILHAILSSTIVTGVGTLLILVLGAAAAYPLTRLKTRTNKTILALILVMMMVPPLSILVPLYSMLVDISGINTYWGITLALVAEHLPLAIFMYSAFLGSVPYSLEEAAALDGAGLFRRLFGVVFPLLKPVTASVAILAGVPIWNEFPLSVYILNDQSVRTIAPTVSTFFSQQTSNLGAASAASLVALVPILVVYLFLQRYFMEGAVAGAVK